MGRIYDELLKFFEDWSFMQNDEQTFLKIPYVGNAGAWNCFAQALEEPEQLVVYSVYPANATTELRPALAELITRLNYGLIMGNFEMDYGDGEVRFKTSLDVKQTALTADLIRPVVYFNVALMDRYFPALAAVVEQRATPREAFEMVEGGQAGG
jgi:hypothetical protein